MSFYLIILGFVVLFYIIYRFYGSSNVDPHGKYILISGCDSGFGHELAVRLDEQGFNILAGVLLPESVKSLTKKLSSRSNVFVVDITKDEDIDSFYDNLQRKGVILHALVNNARIDGGSYVDMTSMDVMRRLMNVNFYGHVSMTKKCLSLLLKKRGSRVVNICSVAGYIASPGLAAYCASKC